jgi:hypothetical protein
MRKRPLSVTISDFEYDLLQALASERDRSLSYIVGHAIEIMAYHGSTEVNGEWGSPVLSREDLKLIEQKHDMLGRDKVEG